MSLPTAGKAEDRLDQRRRSASLPPVSDHGDDGQIALRRAWMKMIARTSRPLPVRSSQIGRGQRADHGSRAPLDDDAEGRTKRTAIGRIQCTTDRCRMSQDREVDREDDDGEIASQKSGTDAR